MTTISSAAQTMFASAALTNFATQLGAMMRFGSMRFTPFAMGQNNMPQGACCFLPSNGNAWAPSVPAAPSWTASMPKDGKATVDLGDGYTMDLNEASSEIVIRDGDGNVTRIWGDPHVDVNGTRSGDFYDTTTFELENGTKITINTEPWKNNANAYVASQVVVTKGDQGMVIDGISQNEKGDLSITMGQDGEALDFQHDDGYNVYEQDLGGGDYGWTSEFTGERMTRADWELTKHANREVREALEYDRDMGQAVMGWLMFGDLGAALSFSGTETAERIVRDVMAPVMLDAAS
ncbi:MAG: DUF1521 domain-containing protein [Pseudomonadota bacterium]